MDNLSILFFYIPEQKQAIQSYTMAELLCDTVPELSRGNQGGPGVQPHAFFFPQPTVYAACSSIQQIASQSMYLLSLFNCYSMFKGQLRPNERVPCGRIRQLSNNDALFMNLTPQPVK